MPKPNPNREDTLNAIITDLVADQVIRALELGYTNSEVCDAVEMGLEHGVTERSLSLKNLKKSMTIGRSI